jgi:uncharacterized membrane protein (DUF485 family)
MLILSQIISVRFAGDSHEDAPMLGQILDALFFGSLIYMLAGVLFALLRSPRFYEFSLLVAAPSGAYHYTNDFRTLLMAFVLCGLFVVLADTAFQSQRNQVARKLTRPIDSRSQVH